MGNGASRDLGISLPVLSYFLVCDIVGGARLWIRPRH